MFLGMFTGGTGRLCGEARKWAQVSGMLLGRRGGRGRFLARLGSTLVLDPIPGQVQPQDDAQHDGVNKVLVYQASPVKWRNFVR